MKMNFRWKRKKNGQRSEWENKERKTKMSEEKN